MEQVIAAFEHEGTGRRVKELLERSGTAQCLPCRSAAQVKRLCGERPIPLVICGYKFPDGSAESLYADLPSSCAMLLLASQGMLELCRSEGIFKLTAPVAKGALTNTVGRILRDRSDPLRVRRTPEEEETIRLAKKLLMDCRGMDEEQAHRFLQKKSMDWGVKLARAAERVARWY